jgi:hypothetical protein
MVIKEASLNGRAVVLVIIASMSRGLILALLSASIATLANISIGDGTIFPASVQSVMAVLTIALSLIFIPQQAQKSM